MTMENKDRDFRSWKVMGFFLALDNSSLAFYQSSHLFVFRCRKEVPGTHTGYAFDQVKVRIRGKNLLQASIHNQGCMEDIAIASSPDPI